MGSEYRVVCRQCGHHFAVREGGGFTFHLLHCEQCGREKAISQEEMGSAFDADEARQDQWIGRNVAPCGCGGRFSMEALARCPKCRSGDWQVDTKGPGIMYD